MKKHTSHTKEMDQVVVDEITLDGQNVVVKIEDLPLDLLRLDPQNPRIANTLSIQSHTKSHSLDSELDKLLWSDPDVRDLYRQILVNRGLIERIIVRSDYVVAEGNCRLVVYRRLSEKFSDDATWKRIPSRVLPANTPERSIALLLAQMHVTGKNQWSPFEKAGHIYKLYKDFVLTQDEIAARLKMSKSQVNNSIHAFEAMTKHFFKDYPHPGSIRKFSYFLELFKNPDLKKWLAGEPQALERFCDWVGTDKLSQGAQVRLLPKIVQNKSALAALDKNGFQEAREILGQDDPVVSSTLFKKMVEMTDLLREARLDDIRRANPKENPTGQRIVHDLREALQRFIELGDRTS